MKTIQIQVMASPADRLHALVRRESATAAQERSTTTHRLEDVEFMHATGETWERIAHRLGVNLHSLCRWLRNNDQLELSRAAENAHRAALKMVP